MIQHPKYTFLEIPFTGSEQVASWLEENLKGSRITPKYGTASPRVGVKTFTFIRKPYSRIREMFYTNNPDAKPGELIEWFEWLRSREEDPHCLLKPYSNWLVEGVIGLKVEKLENTLPILFKALGFRVKNLPKVVFKDDFPKLTEEEYKYVAKKWQKDFINNLYKIDRRTKV